MGRKLDWPLVLGSLVSVAAMGLAGVAVGSRPPTRSSAHQGSDPNPEAFWGPMRVQGMEAERYDRLAGMAVAADLVVVGTLANVRVGRIIQGDAAEDVVTLGAADISVEHVVRGVAPNGLVPLEFLVPLAADRAPSAIAAMQSSVPQGRLVMFLRHKGGAEDGLYRLVNSYGLWTSDGETLTAPLTSAGGGASPDFPALSVEESLRQFEEDRAEIERLKAEGIDSSDAIVHIKPEDSLALVDDDSEEIEEFDGYQSELAGLKTIDDLVGLLDSTL